LDLLQPPAPPSGFFHRLVSSATFSDLSRHGELMWLFVKDSDKSQIATGLYHTSLVVSYRIVQHRRPASYEQQAVIIGPA
jgi:hypothetical protein